MSMLLDCLQAAILGSNCFFHAQGALIPTTLSNPGHGPELCGPEYKVFARFFVLAGRKTLQTHVILERFGAREILSKKCLDHLQLVFSSSVSSTSQTVNNLQNGNNTHKVKQSIHFWLRFVLLNTVLTSFLPCLTVIQNWIFANLFAFSLIWKGKVEDIASSCQSCPNSDFWASQCSYKADLKTFSRRFSVSPKLHFCYCFSPLL